MAVKTSWMVTDIKQELSNGKLPQVLREQWRVIEPSTPKDKAELKYFEASMREISESLLAKNDNPSDHQYRFVLCEEEQPNAFIVSLANPPIMGITKGLLAKAQNMDQIAATISHEMFHHRVWLRTKKENEVTKGEEVFCDLATVETMQDAGYAPDEVLTALREVFHGQVSSVKSLLSYLDPHPQATVIDRLIENMIVAVRRKYGDDYNRTITPMDSRLAAIGKRGKEYSDSLGQRLDKIGNISNVEARFDALVQFAMQESKDWSYAHTHRRESLLQSISECGFDLHHPNFAHKAESIINKIFDRVNLELANGDYQSMGHAQFLKSLLRSVSSLDREAKDREWSRTRMPKRIVEYAGHLRDLRNATTYETALQAAKKASACIKPTDRLFGYTNSAGWTVENPGNYIHSQMPYFSPPSLDVYDRPRRKVRPRATPLKPYPTGECPLEPSWYKHLLWAQQDTSGAIANGLVAIGLELPEDIKQKVRLPSYQQSKDETSLNPDIYILDEQKRILGWWKAERQLDWPEQMERYFKKRNIQEQNYIAKANWDLLIPSPDQEGAGRKFWRFVRENQVALQPEVTMPGSVRHEAFAEKFAAYLRAQIDAYPDNYQYIHHQFLTGRTPYENYRLHHNWDSVGKNEGDTEARDYTSITALSFPCFTRAAFAKGSSERNTSKKIGVSPINAILCYLLDDPERILTPADKFNALAATHQEALITKDKAQRAYDVLAHGLHHPDERLSAKLISLQNYIQGSGRLSSYGNYRDIRSYGPSGTMRLSDAAEHAFFRSVLKQANEEEFSPREYAHFAKRATEVASSVFTRPVIAHQISNMLDYTYDANKLVHWHHHLSHVGLIYPHESIFHAHPKLQIVCQKKLLNAIGYQSLAGQINSYTSLLRNWRPGLDEKASDSVPAVLDDVKFRAEVIRGLSNALVELHGKDTPYAPREYPDIIMALINPALEGLDSVTTHSLIRSVGDATCAQQKLAGALYQKLKDAHYRDITSQKWAGIGADMILSSIGHSESGRTDLLNFIAEPLTDKTLKAVTDKIPLYLGTGWKPKTMSKIGAKSIFIKMHHGFWAMPFETRALILDGVIFPNGEHNQAGFDEACLYVEDKILPPGSQYAEVGRELIRAYLDTCDLPEKRLLLTAMFAAREQQSSLHSDDESIGIALGIILDAMGPAGRKLKQAIHSHPDTPEIIRERLLDGKMKVDIPMRHEVFEDMGNNLPSQLRHSYRHVGDVLGGGGYAYANEVQRKDKSFRVLNQIRPNAMAQATAEYTRLLEVSNRLACKNSAYAPLKEMVMAAMDLAKFEGTYEYAPRQTNLAQTQYSGLCITVEGKQYEFLPPKLTAHGKHYKETEYAKGAHLVDTEVQDRSDLSQLSTALFTAEIHQWLKGGCFDNDRHGGNVKIARNIIQPIDPGSMQLVPPSPRELEVLGTTLGRALADHLDSLQDIGQCLERSMLQTLNDPKMPHDYMQASYRGLLALEDCRRAMRPDQLRAAFATVLASGGIHPEITQAMLSQLKPEHFQKLQESAVSLPQINLNQDSPLHGR